MIRPECFQNRRLQNFPPPTLCGKLFEAFASLLIVSHQRLAPRLNVESQDVYSQNLKARRRDWTLIGEQLIC